MPRRLLAPLVAVTAVAVLVTGAVTALTGSTEEAADVLRPAEQPAVAQPQAPAPTSAAPTTPAATPAPAKRDAPADPAVRTKAVAPAPGPAAPRREAPQSAPDDGSGYGSTPGVVKHPYDPGRRSYRASANGVTLTATFSTMTPKAGEAVTVTLAGSSDAPSCCTLHVLYGDGAGDDQQLPPTAAACGQGGTSAEFDAQHAWNKPGRWTLQLQAGAHDCDAERYVVMRVTVDVREGAPPVSNGPALPKVAFDLYEYPKPEDPGLVRFSGSAEDRDGHVTHFVLDPGDGSAPRRIDAYKQGPCQQNPSGQSAASTGFLPHDPPPSHRYAEPGTYTATLTAYSVGCDGKHVQSGSATYTHSW